MNVKRYIRVYSKSLIYTDRFTARFVFTFTASGHAVVYNDENASLDWEDFRDAYKKVTKVDALYKTERRVFAIKSGAYGFYTYQYDNAEVDASRCKYLFRTDVVHHAGRLGVYFLTSDALYSRYYSSFLLTVKMLVQGNRQLLGRPVELMEDEILAGWRGLVNGS